MRDEAFEDAAYEENEIEDGAIDDVPTQTLVAHSASKQRRPQLNDDEKKAEDERDAIINLRPRLSGQRPPAN